MVSSLLIIRYCVACADFTFDMCRVALERQSQSMCYHLYACVMRCAGTKLRLSEKKEKDSQLQTHCLICMTPSRKVPSSSIAAVEHQKSFTTCLQRLTVFHKLHNGFVSPPCSFSCSALLCTPHTELPASCCPATPSRHCASC
jgi:hypothetical protein